MSVPTICRCACFCLIACLPVCLLYSDLAFLLPLRTTLVCTEESRFLVFTWGVVRPPPRRRFSSCPNSCPFEVNTEQYITYFSNRVLAPAIRSCCQSHFTFHTLSHKGSRCLSPARYSFLYHHQRSDWFVNERWGEIYGTTGPPKPRAVVNDKEVQAWTLETLARSSAQACAGAAPAAVPASVCKSQSQEDEHLLSFFGGFCGGTYVKLGALDGITFSNTYAFNKALGWKGVLIELSPTTFARLRANRPNELAVVNAVV